MAKKILILLCLISLMTMPAVFAADWRLAHESNRGDDKWYVDIDTVRLRPDNMTFWYKIETTNGPNYSSAVCLSEVVYSQGQMIIRDLQCTFYKNGKSLTSQGGDWSAVIPGSNIDEVISFAKKYARR